MITRAAIHASVRIATEPLSLASVRVANCYKKVRGWARSLFISSKPLLAFLVSILGMGPASSKPRRFRPLPSSDASRTPGLPRELLDEIMDHLIDDYTSSSLLYGCEDLRAIVPPPPLPSGGIPTP